MEYLPSKNFIKIVGSIITVLVVGWLVLYVWNNGKQLGAGIQNSNTASLIAESEKDTDNDGLKDWEENLWRTNPKLIDTDGDGTEDAVEVKNGRNPTTAGACEKTCTDKLQTPEELSQKNTNTPSTLTAKIAEEFSKNYFGSKAVVDGQNLSADAEQSLADSIVLGVEQGLASYQDIFNKEDIKISDSIKPKDYLNKIGTILSKNFKNITKSEVDIINLVISEQHFENLELFNPLILAYKNSINDIKKEVVPTSYEDFQLEELNIFQNTLFAIRNMKDIKNDPTKAVVGLRLYTKEGERAKNMLINLKKQIEKDNITFEKNEGGYFLKQYFDNS